MSFLSTAYGRLIQAILIVYGFFMLSFWVMSDFVLYQPPVPQKLPASIQPLHIAIDDKAYINAVFIKNPKAQYTILLSHGNAEDLSTLIPYLRYLSQFGFNVFAYDYRGYGQSPGKPSESNTYADIDAAYRYLTQNLKIDANHIVIFGRSLGAGPSLYLAQHHPARALILEAPFLSAYRVVTRIPLFPFDKYPNSDRIKDIKMPFLVIHGTHDMVIPFWHGERLYHLGPSPKQHFWIKGADHNTLIRYAPEQYWQRIKNFIQNPTS